MGNNIFPIGVNINGNASTALNSTVLTPGWNYIDGYWYYADASSNTYRDKWCYDSGSWYYLRNDGKMYTGGPFEISGDYYTFSSPDGKMLTGWYYDHLKRGWYYFNTSSGAMVKNNWISTSGKWYYLKDDGVMARNTTIGGYYVNDNGEWVK